MRNTDKLVVSSSVGHVVIDMNEVKTNLNKIEPKLIKKKLNITEINQLLECATVKVYLSDVDKIKANNISNVNANNFNDID